MVLLHLLMRNKYQLVVAHVNFQLREKESEEDEDFVRAFCKQHQLPLLVKNFNTPQLSKTTGKGIQEIARELRYQWFMELVQEGKAQLVVVAHQADDQAETILFNLLRGTGVKGLRGMLAIQGSIRRPLLVYSKQQLLEYASQNGISFRTDSSNLNDDYTRNFIRHQIIPKIHQIQPAFSKQITSFSERMQAAWHYYQRQTDVLKQQLMEETDMGWKINLAELRSVEYPVQLLFEWLHPIGFNQSQCEAILGSAKLPHSGAVFPVSGFEAVVDRDVLWVRKTDNEVNFSDTQIEHLPFTCLIGRYTYVITESEFTGFESNTWWLDLDTLQFPLQLRKPKPGDSFIPLGMYGHKKLSDLITDRKTPLDEKEQVLVLCSAEDVVIALPLQVSENHKISNNTKRYLKIARLGV